MPSASYKPEWAKYEDKMRTGTAQEQQTASDQFLAARDHALKTDPQARRYEESRRDRLAKDKPAWVKMKRRQETEPLERLNQELRSGGMFDEPFKPAPGYLLVNVEKREAQTRTGIYLAEDALEKLNNVGEVVDVGDPQPTSGNPIPAPCQPGDKIIFKKGAGIDMGVMGQDCRFMLFSDVLGVFYDTEG
jgi:co-chaperonin GroES (HSP10)